ncbi:hypothetical protein M9434_005830 [Picochlorum sp. BPE23]|nr:hypothetical protein M9434_005830 [Picochlorum sp. BPE23]
MGLECLTLSTVLSSLSSRPQRETCRQRRALICRANAPKDKNVAIKNNSKNKVLRKNPAIYKKPTGLEEHIVPSGRTLKKPEVLAPAGGWPQLMSACENGADAVYFGVSSFNARARAENFDPDELPAVMEYLHTRGLKGYLVLNVLIFDDELADMVINAQKAAASGVDAVIVQDLGAVELIKKGAPGLPIHGSTQMTVTSAEGLKFASNLGMHRVVVGRELSVEEITEMSDQTWDRNVEIEAFVHGAMCVSYSGQCFSSEAWGGRSANRGQCAQACRLPYGLIVDGELKDLADQKYLLSPQDLAAADLMPELIRAGIVSLKIEGRLKSPEYVAITCQVYREAVDKAWRAIQDGNTDEELRLVDDDMWHDLQTTFARGQDATHSGLTHGFLKGPKHQTLVRGRNPRHRGVYAGEILGTDAAKQRFTLHVNTQLKRGDGLVIDQGMPESDEVGGAIFRMFTKKSNTSVDMAHPGDTVDIVLGPSPVDLSTIRAGDLVWKNKDPALMSRLKASYTSVSSGSRRRKPLNVSILFHGIGKPLEIQIKDGDLQHSAYTQNNVEKASKRPVTHDMIEKAIGVHLGDEGSFVMETCQCLHFDDDDIFISMKDIKDARRRALAPFLLHAANTMPDVSQFPDAHQLVEYERKQIASKDMPAIHNGMKGPRLRILCRTPAQVDAALEVDWLEEVILDFLEVKGLQQSCKKVKNAGKRVIVATPRIMKPEEKYLWIFYVTLGADALLIRSAGLLHHFMTLGGPGAQVPDANNAPIPALEGDFSLNATNIITADLLLNSGLDSLALTYDCNSAQISGILEGLQNRSQQMEIIIHSNLPIFHTEHCIFARYLSDGNSYKDCGRPCEHHTIHIRDPTTGRDHLVEADMGCRNTVFEGSAQSGLNYIQDFSRHNAGIYRIELVDQPPHIVKSILQGYKDILSKPGGHHTFTDWIHTIPDANGRCHGASSGSFEVKKEQSKDSMKKTAASQRT